MRRRAGAASLSAICLFAAPACEERDAPTAPIASPTWTATATPTATDTATPTPAPTPTPTLPACFDLSGRYEARWELPECGRREGPVLVQMTQAGCIARAEIPNLGRVTIGVLSLLSRSTWGFSYAPPCSGSTAGTHFPGSTTRLVFPLPGDYGFIENPQCPGCFPRGVLTLTPSRVKQ